DAMPADSDVVADPDQVVDLRAILQDDVQIGANATIDRGADRDTVIGEGAKIDNLVRIGHNVTVGRHCVVLARSQVPPGATLDDFAVVGNIEAAT
ncbi:hypothetical protein ACIKTA_12955, partial [Hansschlegelia beijingensis]